MKGIQRAECRKCTQASLSCSAPLPVGKLKYLNLGELIWKISQQENAFFKPLVFFPLRERENCNPRMLEVLPVCQNKHSQGLWARRAGQELHHSLHLLLQGFGGKKNSQYLQLGGLQLPPLQEEEGSERRGRQWRGSVTFAFTTAHSKSFWASAKLHSAEALT